METGRSGWTSNNGGRSHRPDGLEVRDEAKRGLQDNSLVFGLSTWAMWLFTEMGKRKEVVEVTTRMRQGVAAEGVER